MPATWDSEYCLGFYNRLIGRSGTVGADSIVAATKYQHLSEAQNEVVADIAAICPHVLYPTAPYASLPTLTISADGKVGTFGTDANLYPKFPMGKSGIFQSLNDIPDSPFLDYMWEGTQIRALNNSTLPATLYWYGIYQPADIDATVQPALNPEAARELIAIRAAYNFGTGGNRNVALSNTMAARYGYPLGDGPGRFAFWCLVYKTQFRGGGALNSYTGMQLALGGSYNSLMT